ncbi:MAG: hypothetical protein J0I20_24055 [Chloroflexi bacterium]|nr:hypothetical protein [Chloroflexota bacterium]OJW03412.1 MAG: hypothetical protein BGO39_10410 [Chloroflexi bacterium 54-19]
MDIARQVRRYLRVLKSWAWLILLGALLAGGTNYYFVSESKPTYEASTTLMVGQTIRQANPEQQEIALADQLATYYQELLKRQPVVEGVKKDLNLDLPLDALEGMLTTRVVPNTSFIELAVTDTDPTRAVRIVNAFGAELIKQSPTAPENQQAQQRQFVQKQLDDLQGQIENGRKDLDALNQSLTGTGITAAEIADTRSKIKALQAQIDVWQSNYTNLLQNTNLSSPNSITVLEVSKQAHLVKGLNPLLTTAITVSLGMLIAFGFAVFLEYLDDRIKSQDDIRDNLNMPLLGHLSRKALKPKPSKMAKAGEGGDIDPNFDLAAMFSNEYELLCSNIRFSKTFSLQRKSMVITSPNFIKNQAKIARDLAVAMSSFEQSILVIDANSNHPELHKLLNLENQSGFYEVFYEGGGLSIADTIQRTAISNLYLMSAGIDTSNGAKMILAGPATKRIFELPNHSLPGDFVIFNCESLLTDKTARLLSSQIIATVLLCELNRTRGRELKEAAEIVDRLNGTVLGVVTIPRSGWSFTWGFHRKNGKNQSRDSARAKKKASRNKNSAGIDDSKVSTIPTPTHKTSPVDSSNAADSSGDSPYIELSRVINLGPSSTPTTPVYEDNYKAEEEIEIVEYIAHNFHKPVQVLKETEETRTTEIPDQSTNGWANKDTEALVKDDKHSWSANELKNGSQEFEFEKKEEVIKTGHNPGELEITPGLTGLERTNSRSLITSPESDSLEKPGLLALGNLDLGPDLDPDSLLRKINSRNNVGMRINEDFFEVPEI